MNGVFRVAEGDARVDDLLARHHALMRSQSPEESCHVLTSDELRASGARVFACEEGGAVVAVGAWTWLEAGAVEIKSMHVAAEARGRGLAARMLAHLLDSARAEGARSAWLETGSRAPFAAARALYARAGFTLCPPFGAYVPDPESVFMTRAL